ncbi:lipopolysaccharide biosynthesis protein [Leifsonia sp. NPDC058230]|uniref:lipopolysaccharide biosynthesis protein n=1 Tax=Leifsonia sp. NPDC058230 TaxID=3346391 RepID=UPI0036D82E26
MKKVPSRALVAQHGRALAEIGAVTILGVLATTGFQIVTIRGLGPAEFGLLASFVAIINVASIGSAALRNSVAVVTASQTGPTGRHRWFDGPMIEALVLGAIGTIGVLVLAPFLASSLGSSPATLILTAIAITPYFLFARAQGLLQGAGNSRAVVWWSTGAQLAQLVLAVLVLLAGFGAIGVLVVLVVCAIGGAVGASFEARKIAVQSATRPFTLQSTIVLALTIGLAWLTNADVVLVRAHAPEAVAGAFAAAAVLIKTTLIIPATLSLYLLPRFVNRRGDASMMRLGVNVVLGVTLASGLLMLAVVSIAGDLIVHILFGAGYSASVQYLPLFALTWIPWALAQAILIRITASASLVGVGVLVIAIVAQYVGALIVLPDVMAMMILNGCVGLFAFGAMYVVHLLTGRKLTVRSAEQAGLDG